MRDLENGTEELLDEMQEAFEHQWAKDDFARYVGIATYNVSEAIRNLKKALEFQADISNKEWIKSIETVLYHLEDHTLISK